jgi:hypothetical protein
LSTPRCAIVGVHDWAGTPVESVAHSRRIYGDHALLRAAALFGPHERSTVELPTEIAPLVQRAYGADPIGPASWEARMTAAHNQASRQAAIRAEDAKKFLLGRADPATATLVSWLSGSVGDADDTPQGRAQVRDGEENLEVLVVQSDGAGGLQTPSWISRGGGQAIPTEDEVPYDLARIIMACSLRLPLALSHAGIIDDTLAALEKTRITGFQLTRMLNGQLVLVLDGNRTAVLDHGNLQVRLTYDVDRGLLHEFIDQTP